MENTPVPTAEAGTALPLVAPRVDIFENEDEIMLIADLPGVRAPDLTVRLEKDVLYIEAAPTLENAETAAENGVLAREFAPVRYRRAFVLQRDLDSSKIRADLRNGELTLHVPRSDAARARRIEVHEA